MKHHSPLDPYLRMNVRQEDRLETLYNEVRRTMKHEIMRLNHIRGYPINMSSDPHDTVSYDRYGHSDIMTAYDMLFSDMETFRKLLTCDEVTSMVLNNHRHKIDNDKRIESMESAKQLETINGIEHQLYEDSIDIIDALSDNPRESLNDAQLEELEEAKENVKRYEEPESHGV